MHLIVGLAAGDAYATKEDAPCGGLNVLQKEQPW